MTLSVSGLQRTKCCHYAGHSGSAIAPDVLYVAGGVCNDPVTGLQLHGLLAVIRELDPACAQTAVKAQAACGNHMRSMRLRRMPPSGLRRYQTYL